MNRSPIEANQAKLVTGEVLYLPCTVNYFYITDQNEAQEAVIEIVKYLDEAKDKKYALDLETSGLDPYLAEIVSVQIGLRNNVQYIFDARFLDLSVLSPVLKYACWKIGHNIRFDVKLIKTKLGLTVNKLFDTFLAEQVIRGGTYYGGGGYSLDAIVASRLGRELKISTSDFRVNTDKKVETAKKYMQMSFIKMAGTTELLSDAQLAYAAQDVAYGTIIEVSENQKKDLMEKRPNTIYNPEIDTCRFISAEAKKEYKQFYQKELSLWPTALLEFQFLEVVADMELNGIKFDTNVHDIVLGYVREDYKAYRTDFLGYLSQRAKQKTLFGVASVNPDSTKQVLNSLNELGLSLEDTSADTLENVIRDLDKTTKVYQVVESLLGYRQAAKLLSTYAEDLSKFIHSKTGRIHMQVKQIVDTGRISNKQPNCQNVPNTLTWRKSGDQEKDAKLEKRPGFRDCFVPEKGYKFIVYDYSAQEMRVAASISMDPLMIAAFKHNKDLHSYSASLMYKEDYDEFVKKYKSGDKEAKEKRQQAKVVSFGSLYGSGPSNLSSKLHITMDEAKEILERYWEAYPDLSQAMARYGKAANKLGYSNTILGRRRYYTDIIQKIKWVQYETNPKVIQKKVEELKMDWLLEDGPIIDDNIEYAKSRIIKKHMSRIARQAGNHHIQGSSADMLKAAAVFIRREILKRGFDAKIVALIHDEIIVEAAEPIIEECRALVEDNLKKAMLMLCPNVPAEVEGRVADSWKK
jgi:DNA polymerase I